MELPLPPPRHRPGDDFRCIAVDYPGFGLSDRPAGHGYTRAEHADAVGELVDQLELDGLLVLGHDWGGPIGLSVAVARAPRVAGLVLGNTWFWPSDRRARAFSSVMSSRPMQWAICRRNFFVERFIPSGVVRRGSATSRWSTTGLSSRRPRIEWGWRSSPASSPPGRGSSSWH